VSEITGICNHELEIIINEFNETNSQIKNTPGLPSQLINFTTDKIQETYPSIRFFAFRAYIKLQFLLPDNTECLKIIREHLFPSEVNID